MLACHFHGCSGPSVKHVAILHIWDIAKGEPLARDAIVDTMAVCVGGGGGGGGQGGGGGGERGQGWGATCRYIGLAILGDNAKRAAFETSRAK